MSYTDDMENACNSLRMLVHGKMHFEQKKKD